MKKKREEEGEKVVDKGRGNSRGEHLQALELLDILLLSRLLSYPLSSHFLNQQGGSQFKHLVQGSPLAYHTPHLPNQSTFPMPLNF